MTDHENPTSSLSVTVLPRLLRYLRIDDSHAEVVLRGALWAYGPSLGVKGGILWVLTGPTCVPVLVVRRRHRGLGGRGRWMEEGEAYLDSAVAEAAGRARVVRKEWAGGAPPPWRRWARPGDTHIAVPPLPPEVVSALSGEGPHDIMSP